MTPIEVPMFEKREPWGKTFASEAQLHLMGTYHRYGVGFVPRGTKCRREFQGPLEDGPYAYAFGLPTVMAANPEHGTAAEVERLRARGLIIEVRPDDLLSIEGEVYRVKVKSRIHIELEHVGAAIAPVEARRLTGRCVDGGERDSGRLFHAVQRGDHVALCGAKPGRRSVGWSTDEGERVTCARCLSKVKTKRRQGYDCHQ